MIENNQKTVGIIYYTDNELDDNIMSACQKQLLKVSSGKKLDTDIVLIGSKAPLKLFWDGVI